MKTSSLIEDKPVAAISQFIERDQHVLFDRHVRRGRNGEVYFGTRIKLGDEVVYKFYMAQAGYDSIEEAVILKGIDHPNILKIFDLRFLHPHYAYFVTPKISGEDLQFILSNKRFSTHEVLNIMEGILKGLTELHSIHKIVHRDLKLGNILLDLSSHQPIIADLGTVKKIDNVNGGTTASQSTFLYLPPEAVLRNEYYFQSDIYQVGVMMFQLLGGYFPIDETEKFLTSKELKQNTLIRNSEDRAKHFDDLISNKISKGKLLDVSTLPEYLDTSFIKTLKTATHIDHNKRFANASLFLKEIHQLQRKCPNYLEDGDSLLIQHSDGKEYKVYKNHKNEIVLEKKSGINWRKDNSHDGSLNSVMSVARKK